VCNSAQLDLCKSKAQAEAALCSANCLSSSSALAICEGFCAGRLAISLFFCEAQNGCLDECTTCSPSDQCVSTGKPCGLGVCCPSGEDCCFSLSNTCLPACGANQHYDSLCNCVCNPTTCPPGATQDPHTCQCVCPQGQTLCNSACVNTQTDDSNCGMCGHACPSGQTCSAGVCGCNPGVTCLPGVTKCCGSQCIPASYVCCDQSTGFFCAFQCCPCNSLPTGFICGNDPSQGGICPPPSTC
jgi:hypothetical protein